MWLREDGLFHITKEWEIYQHPTHSDFYCDGAHIEFVLGALAAGASAVQAVELAIKFGDSARGPVQSERLLNASTVPPGHWIDLDPQRQDAELRHLEDRERWRRSAFERNGE